MLWTILHYHSRRLVFLVSSRPDLVACLHCILLSVQSPLSAMLRGLVDQRVFFAVLDVIGVMWICSAAHPSPLWIPFLRMIWSPSLAAFMAACTERKLKPLLTVPTVMRVTTLPGHMPLSAHVNKGERH